MDFCFSYPCFSMSTVLSRPETNAQCKVFISSSMESSNVAEMSDEDFPARLLLAASRDILIIGISWDVYTLASKGMSSHLST